MINQVLCLQLCFLLSNGTEFVVVKRLLRLSLDVFILPNASGDRDNDVGDVEDDEDVL